MNWTGTILTFASFFWMSVKVNNAENNDEAAKPFLLPKNLWPDSYNVVITVNLEESDFSFNGSSEITIKCLQATKSVILNVKDLEIDTTAVKVKQAQTDLKITDQKPDKDNQLYIITMEQELVAETYYLVYVPFSGVTDVTRTGLYRTSYFNRQTNKVSWIAVTQAEPSHLRSVFPCLDELRYKSFYTLSIGHHKRFKALSNTPIAQTKNIDNKMNYVMDTFKQTKLLSTYLVAFVIVDFESYELKAPDYNIPVTVWARKELIPQTQVGQDVTLKSLAYFTDYFGIKLEIEKLDLVVVPNLAYGGMENSGLTTFSEWDFLYHEGVSFASDKVNTAKVAAHEMCHSWMGNMASFQDYRSDWVKEGFANYFEKLALSELDEYKDLQVLEPEWTISFYDALSTDGLLASRKLAYNIQSVHDPDFLFDNITYKKGSMLMRMLSFVMGDEPFQRAVSTFVKTYKDKVAKTEDVWQILTDKSRNSNVFLPPDTSIGDIMNTWTEQRGYAKLTVTRDLANNKVIIKQAPFDFNNDKEADDRCWWMPISFITKQSPKIESVAPKYWFGCKEDLEITDIKLEKDDWIILNPRLTALTNEKDYLQIDVLSRAQFLSDLHGLAWIGDIEYKVLFEALNLLKHETEYPVWITGLAILSSLRYMLSITDIINPYTAFAKTIVEPAFLKDSNINEFKGDTNYIRRKALFISWACGFGAGDCEKQATDLFNLWMKEPNPDVNNPILAPARSTVYCWGIVSGGQAAFDFLLERFKNTIVATERVIMIDALACAQENKIINNFLFSSIDETLYGQSESYEIFAAFSLDDLATNSLFDFFLQKFDDIYTFHRGNPLTMGKYVITLFTRITTQERFDQFTAFLETKKDKLLAADIRVKEAISIGRDNLLFFKRHFDYLKNYFAQTNNGSG